MPDSAEELEDLLKMFYQPWDLPFRRYHPDTYNDLKNVLAMATKYVSHIEQDWPSTLKEWDRFNDHVNRRLFSEHYYLAGEELLEPASALVLAKRFGIRKILPAVYYDLSRLRPLDDWDDLRSSEGLHPSIKSTYEIRTALWRLLSSDDFLHLQRGKNIIEEDFTGVNYPVQMRGNFCNTGDCSESRGIILGDIVKACSRKDLDVLQSLQTFAERTRERGSTKYYQLCFECSYRITKFLEILRQDTWNKLPKIFGFNN
ncbi:hypothetical protein DFH11DRAFT_612130 [Phellopilus nigrolimitatus]|nr:hypothetical protein DFH11DRAFT_612130 [Phellopilus nigrolimitatus]